MFNFCNFMKKFFGKIKVLIFLFLFLPACSWAMSSETYKINADTINSGGNLSGSSSYNLGDSLGESAVGVETSANYKSNTAFWHMVSGGAQLGLNCEAANVYMVDYTLGNANNYSKYIFSTSQECVVVDNSSVPWTLTMQSTDMTSTKNNLANNNVFLVTDGAVASGDTITSPTTGISESASSDYSLNTPRSIISGDVTAAGIYNNRPTVKLTNLNSLFNENITGTVTITIQ